MKKAIAIAAVLMLVPFTAFGLEMMADTALEDVTGQAGVSISIDNVQLDFQMDYLSWGDGDGLDGSGAGFVNITQMRMTNIVIDKLGIGASDIAPIAFSAGGATQMMVGDPLTPGWTSAAQAMDLDPTDGASDLAYLTIDVGEHTIAYDASGTAITDTAVRIGVPTLTIYVGSIAPFDICLDSAAGISGTALGSVAVGGMQLDTKGGNLYIFAH
jgi:hypothetical protein